MGMSICKSCGEQVAKDAKACPKCGKDQRNFFKKHPVWSTICIIFILSIVFGTSGSSDEPKNTLNNSGETVQTTAPIEEKTEYKVGEIFENDYVAVKFSSINTNFKGYSKYADVKKGYKVIQATFEFQNVGTTDEYISSGDFTCYSDEYSCEQFYWTEDSSFYETISAGKKIKGSVYFQVPTDAKEITLEYETNFWTDSKVVFVVK